MERRRRRTRFPEGKVRVKSVEKMGKILRFLAEHPEGAPLKEMSRELGINPSTLHHLLATMKVIGYIEEEDERYRIGLGLVGIVSRYLARTNLFTASYHEAKRLRDKFNETVAVAAYQAGVDYSIIELPSNNYIQINLAIPPSDVPALHATASGKIFLAYSSPEFVSEYIREKGLHKFTSNTITEPESLLKELERIRERGYALDRGEHREGVLCVTAPIFDANCDLVGAIGIITLLFKHSEEEIGEFIRGVTEAAKKISGKLGYLSPEGINCLR
ncbi:MAG: IclR family transcriptional regulator [bacterium]